MSAGSANGGKRRVRCLFLLALLFFSVPVLLLWLVPLRGQKDISETENRALTQWPAFSPDSAISGAYQDALETAAGDQLLLSEEIRSAVTDAESALQSSLLSLLVRIRPSLKNGYAQLAGGYYAYQGDEHRIVEKPGDTSPAVSASLAEQVNALTGVRRYLYFIENSRSVDFDRMEERDRVFQQIASAFRTDGADAFCFEDYGDFCRLFYQTDHHWNYLGSYQGYLSVMKLLGREENLISCGEPVTLPVVFNGSYARQTKMLRADEFFTVCPFQVPKHAETMDGRRGTYGHLSAYLRGKCPDDPLRNHYAYCYGGDYGEIVYDFGDQGKGSLLLIADSYSNPINALIASHFDRTYVIDLRYYESNTGVPFDAASYLSDHPADTLLMLGDLHLFTGGGAAEVDD